MRACIKCGIEKEESLFAKGRNVCKACRSSQSMKGYYKHRDARLQTAAEYRNSNKEKVSKAKSKCYYDNIEYYRNQKRDYYHTHKPEINEQKKIYNKRLYDTTPLYRLKVQVSALIRVNLANGSKAKYGKAVQIIGCSIESLMEQFGVRTVAEMKGMHIDHICPVAQAQTEEEVIKLNHHTNLRLIPASENLLKSDSRTPEGESLCQQLLGRPWIEPTLPQQGLDFPQSPCYNI